MRITLSAIIFLMHAWCINASQELMAPELVAQVSVWRASWGRAARGRESDCSVRITKSFNSRRWYKKNLQAIVDGLAEYEQKEFIPAGSCDQERVSRKLEEELQRMPLIWPCYQQTFDGARMARMLLESEQ